MSDQISLISNEGKKFQTSTNISKLSGFISRIIQDYDNEEIELVNINSYFLGKVLEYSEHHNFNIPASLCKPIKYEEIERNVNDPWDAQFISQFSEDQLIDLTLVCNYLDMKSLQDLCYVCIAGKFKNKSIDYLRQQYHIEEHLTPEVEDKLKKEYPWALEVEKEDFEFK